MSQEALPNPSIINTRRPRFSLRQNESLIGYLLIAPVIICIVVLIVYPFIYAIAISFTDKMVGAEGKFIGLENFAYLFRQAPFLETIRNTIVLVVAVQSLKLVFGMAIAVLLNQEVRGKNIWRGLIFLPWAMPAFVAFITWKLLFAAQGGAVNLVLIGTGLVSSHVDFLSKDLAMPSVIIASFWRGFPFWVISFLAAMQNIPQERYEAAALDGASAWARFRNITVPGIRHVILVVVLLSTIATTNSFEAIWLMTQGGPSNATMTFPVFAYYSRANLRIGEASAVSVAMLPVFAVLALIVAVLLQRQED